MKSLDADMGYARDMAKHARIYGGRVVGYGAVVRGKRAGHGSPLVKKGRL